MVIPLIVEGAVLASEALAAEGAVAGGAAIAGETALTAGTVAGGSMAAADIATMLQSQLATTAVNTAIDMTTKGTELEKEGKEAKKVVAQTKNILKGGIDDKGTIIGAGSNGTRSGGSVMEGGLNQETNNLLRQILHASQKPSSFRYGG